MSVFTEVKHHYNLAHYIEQDLGRPAKRSGRWLYWLCPFHDETVPSFAVNTRTNTAHCFGCGFHGSIIDYHQGRYGLPDPFAAAKALADRAGLAYTLAMDDNPAKHRTPVARNVIYTHSSPPSLDWQTSAYEAMTNWLCDRLWDSDNAKARAWLAARGIDEEAVMRYNLGYVEADVVNGLHFPMGRGIVIPHWYQETGTMYALKIRRPVPPGTPNKYYCALGSKPGASLYNADSLIGRNICFVVEGELDAICLHSKIEDLAAVVTLGSKHAKIAKHWLPHLAHINHFLIATDAGEDEAAAQYWLRLVGRRGRRVLPPGDCKDVCEAAEQGYDLREWAISVLRQKGGSGI
jgi:hypothetical protein